jgi:hypothetical protein
MQRRTTCQVGDVGCFFCKEKTCKKLATLVVANVLTCKKKHSQKGQGCRAYSGRDWPMCMVPAPATVLTA